jgi:hypothetical protein
LPVKPEKLLQESIMKRKILTVLSALALVAASNVTFAADAAAGKA